MVAISGDAHNKKRRRCCRQGSNRTRLMGNELGGEEDEGGQGERLLCVRQKWRKLQLVCVRAWEQVEGGRAPRKRGPGMDERQGHAVGAAVSGSLFHQSRPLERASRILGEGGSVATGAAGGFWDAHGLVSVGFVSRRWPAGSVFCCGRCARRRGDYGRRGDMSRPWRRSAAAGEGRRSLPQAGLSFFSSSDHVKRRGCTCAMHAAQSRDAG